MILFLLVLQLHIDAKLKLLQPPVPLKPNFLLPLPPEKSPNFRSILIELGYSPLGPTILYEDNASAIKMINAGKPTERSRHIDIQHFVIQDWRQQGALTMKAIPGILNPSDDLTKAL
jgi:hypothetical protein